MKTVFPKISNRYREFVFWWRFRNFWELCLRSFNSRYSMVGIYDLSSGPIIIDRGAADPNGVWGCLFWWEYDSALKSLAPFFAKHQSVGVLDCGANVGGFGLLLAQMGIPFREYHAVEMNPRTCGRLAFNLTNWRNQLPAKIINAAVAGENGWVEIEDVFGSDSQSLYDGLNSVASVRVPSLTINNLLTSSNWGKGFPELLKVDIEGAEFDAVPQLDKIALEGTYAILIEIHQNRGRSAEELVAHLAGIGFECVSRPAGEWGVYAFLKSEKITK